MSSILPPPPPSSSPPSSSLLRLATFNLGLGFQRKLPSILDRCLSLSIDVIALQEIGDPALTRTSYSQYLLTASPGPSGHEAGVGLLLSQALGPQCRSYKRSSTGRLVGVVLELSKGERTLLISAYMPSGLDHCSSDDEKVALARSLYHEIAAWSQDAQRVIVMGDLNQTYAAHDRYPALPPGRLASAHAASTIRSLIDDHYTDVYRLLHPDVRRSAGFTHLIHSLVRPSRSRIDYIWTRGISHRSLLSCQVDSSLQRFSHHRLLWMTLQLTHERPPLSTRPLYSPALPNLKELSKEQKQAFSNHLDGLLEKQHQKLSDLELLHTDDATSALAGELTSLVREAALASFPVMGGAPAQSKLVLCLQRTRCDLTRLLRMTQQLHSTHRSILRSPEWSRLHLHCLKQHRLRWSIELLPHTIEAWLEETQVKINQLRAAVTSERQRLRRQRAPPLEANRTAAVHRMIDSDAPSLQIFSVVDSHGKLTSTDEQLEQVMVDHFESVFAIPPLDPRAPRDPPAMLFDKAGIDAAWYAGLMNPPSEEELIELVQDAPLTSAPGQDEVSPGGWKIAILSCEAIRPHILSLFTTCLAASVFPSAWKSSIILPFVKDAQKERTMSNIRPISLQSCLGKLFNKMLADRLGRILQCHPVLNPAQRGFILGGTTMKCIDELLDAWSWARTSQQPIYTLFYDIKQAYDSVQTSVLVRAMHRLHLPNAFIELIADSLTGLTSCIRTVYGLTRRFAVLRSLRQGDPLAPLLFVLLMDALHDGLECNPFDHQRYGCVLMFPSEKIELPSLGYADDTTIIANTLVNLAHQNRWVEYFMLFNCLRLNPLKCELVGQSEGEKQITHEEVVRHSICVDGRPLQPVPHDRPIRYLGVHSCFDGSWKEQQLKTLASINRFTRMANKFNLTVGHTVYMLNVFLMPRIELALHYVHGPGTERWITSCDRLILGCIKHRSESLLRLSTSALTSALRLMLPSTLEQCVKTSELFIRMNSTDARWGKLGRLLMRTVCPSSVEPATLGLPGPNRGNQINRAVYLAVKKLGWSLHLHEESRPDRRRKRLFDIDPLPALPTLADCSSTQLIDLTDGVVAVAHDIWSGWSTPARPVASEVLVFTDGSHDPSSSTSAWSAVVGDRWFDDNFGSLPTDEEELARQPRLLGGSTLIGASITATAGIYPAELEAIARALAMFPLHLDLHIHSDSRASIDAMRNLTVPGTFV